MGRMASRRHTGREPVGKLKYLLCCDRLPAFPPLALQPQLESGNHGGCEAFAGQFGQFRRKGAGSGVFEIEALQISTLSRQNTAVQCVRSQYRAREHCAGNRDGTFDQ